MATRFADELHQLVSNMGFRSEPAHAALLATGGDVAQAVEILLLGQASSVPATAAVANNTVLLPPAPFSFTGTEPVPEHELMRLARLDSEDQATELARLFPSLELEVVRAVLYAADSLASAIGSLRELHAGATHAQATASSSTRGTSGVTESGERRAQCLVVRLAWLDREQQLTELSHLFPSFEPEVIRTVLQESDSLTQAIDVFYGIAAVVLQAEDDRRIQERKERRARMKSRVEHLLKTKPHASRDLQSLSTRFPYLPLPVLIEAYDGELERAVAHLRENGIHELNALESAAMDQTLSQFQNTAQYAERLASMTTRELRHHLTDRRRERHAEVDIAMRYVLNAIDRFGLSQDRPVRTNALFLRVSHLDNVLERASVQYVWQLFTCDEWDPESIVAPREIRDQAHAQARSQMHAVFDQLGVEATTGAVANPEHFMYSVEYNALPTPTPTPLPAPVPMPPPYIVAEPASPVALPAAHTYTMPQRALPVPAPLAGPPYTVAEPASPVIPPAAQTYTMPQRALPVPAPVAVPPYTVAEPASPVVPPIVQQYMVPHHASVPYAAAEPVAQPYYVPAPVPVPVAAADAGVGEPKSVLAQLPTADAQQLLQHLTRSRPSMAPNRRRPGRGGLVGVAAVVQDVQQHLPRNVAVPVTVQANDSDSDDDDEAVPAQPQAERTSEVPAPEPVPARRHFGIALPGMGMFNPAGILAGLKKTGVKLV